jgi:hypothetical protein
VPARPVSFGKYNFPSENKAKQECNRIRDKYLPNERVLDDADDAFLRALVEEHRHREEKVGNGIEYFQVAPTSSLHARTGNFGIWIKQTGVEELVDFGYGGVIRGITDAGGSRQERTRVDRALRNAIRPSTDEFLAGQRASGIREYRWCRVSVERPWTQGRTSMLSTILRGGVSSFVTSRRSSEDSRK